MFSYLTLNAMNENRQFNDRATQELFNIIFEKNDTDFKDLDTAINQGADVNGCYQNTGRTPLENAAYLGKYRMFDYLKEKKAVVTKNCLCYAVCGQNLLMIDRLINIYRIDVNTPNEYQHSPLQCAIRINNKTIIQYLLGFGAKVLLKDHGWHNEIDSLLILHNKNDICQTS